MVIRDALGYGAKQLKRTADAWTSAALDAELLLGHALGMTREALYIHNTHAMTGAQTRRYNTLLTRRKKHEPIAYILGHKDFFGVSFLVERGVCLIPRPETEMLVERAIALLQQDERFQPSETTIVDIGTGSGAIAVSVARTLPHYSIIATDISPAARRIAKKNAKQLGVADRVSVQKADLLPKKLSDVAQTTKAKNGKSSLFLANLPYIPTRRWKSLPLSIRRFEPRSAFDGGPDGLTLYRKLFSQIAENKSIVQWTMLAEIDPGQTHAFSRAVQARFPRATISFHHDLYQQIRCVEITVRSDASRPFQPENSVPR
jgi:release factor glutamine methyltransferase